jgi:ABC-type Zn uptake system ZnuABC Zn-binding protein ZnuA
LSPLKIRERTDKIKIIRLLFAIMLVFLPVEYCKGADSFSSSESLKQVYVVNYPLKYFTERIAQDKVAVLFPAPTDKDPAFWMPDT